MHHRWAVACRRGHILYWLLYQDFKNCWLTWKWSRRHQESALSWLYCQERSEFKKKSFPIAWQKVLHFNVKALCSQTIPFFIVGFKMIVYPVELHVVNVALQLLLEHRQRIVWIPFPLFVYQKLLESSNRNFTCWVFISRNVPWLDT